MFFEEPTDPNKIDYLKNRSPLSLSEMENDCILTNREWIWIAKRVFFPKQQKICLFLYYWQGMPQEEIAIKLNISRSAVGTHIWLARKRIRHFLLVRNNNFSGSGTSQNPT